MEFRIGQDIICVAEEWELYGTAGAVAPMKDQKYTVRSIAEWSTPGLQYIRLVGLKNPSGRYDGRWVEAAYASDGFRPLVEKKTDISIFTAMLTPAPKQTVRA